MQAFEKILRRIEDALHIIGCAALGLIAVLINADVLFRVILGFPLEFQFEMVDIYLMPMVAVLPLSRVFRDGAHLSLDIIQPATFGRLWPAIRVVMLVLAAAFFAVVTIMSGQRAFQAFAAGDFYFGYIDWPLGWAYAAVPVGCAVLTMRLAFDATRKTDMNAGLVDNKQREEMT